MSERTADTIINDVIDRILTIEPLLDELDKAQGTHSDESNADKIEDARRALFELQGEIEGIVV